MKRNKGYERIRADVIEEGRKVAALGARVKITGLWAWAEFATVPDPTLRGQMKNDGWRWCNRKRMWRFAGTPARNRHSMPWAYISEKYGEEEITG